MDCAVPVIMIIPADKTQDPFTGILNGCKAISRVIRTIFTCSEQRFRIWIVIAHAGPAVRGNDTQILHLGNQSKALLRRTVIRMQHRWIDQAAFGPYSFLDEDGCIFGVFPGFD